MELAFTIALAIFGAALTAISVWRSSLPKKDSVNPRWIPWRFLILVGGAILALSVVHISTLLGINIGSRTGRS